MYIFVGQVNIKMILDSFFFPLGPASIEGSPGNREKLGQFCALLYPASSFKLVSCSSCGACPKQGIPFFQHSPDPGTVSHYLSDTTENTPHIKATDCLCLSCYKVHLAILWHINESQNISEIAK